MKKKVLKPPWQALPAAGSDRSIQDVKETAPLNTMRTQ